MLGVPSPDCCGVWGFVSELRQRQSSRAPKTSPKYCSPGRNCALSFSEASLACCSWGRLVLAGLKHSSLLFHRDLGKGSFPSCRDPASPPPSPHGPQEPRAPWKRQRAQSQGQGRRIPAPPPGKARPCTARKSPGEPGDHLEGHPGLRRPRSLAEHGHLALCPAAPGWLRAHPRGAAAACCG